MTLSFLITCYMFYVTFFSLFSPFNCHFHHLLKGYTVEQIGVQEQLHLSHHQSPQLNCSQTWYHTDSIQKDMRQNQNFGRYTIFQFAIIIERFSLIQTQMKWSSLLEVIPVMASFYRLKNLQIKFQVDGDCQLSHISEQVR